MDPVVYEDDASGSPSPLGVVTPGAAAAPPAKLFVGQLPRSFDEKKLVELVQPYVHDGTIVDVVVLRDRATGFHKGCGFVTFSLYSDADRTIDALHNKFSLPEASHSLQVRYADSNAARQDPKLFVGMLPKNITEKELQQVFGAYGTIEEASVLRGTDGISKGCAFVTYTNRTEADAAVAALHQVFSFPGSSGTIVVRYADTEKQRVARKAQQMHMHGLTMHNIPLPLQMQAASLLSATLPAFNAYTQAGAGMPRPAQGGYPAGAPPMPDASAMLLQALVAAASSGYGPQMQQHLQQQQQHPQQQQQMYRPAPMLVPPTQSQGPENSNLFIYHLPPMYGDMELLTLFLPFGRVLSAKVFIDRQTGLSKCFGFVSYDNPASAAMAIQTMNGYHIEGKHLKVQLKQQKPRTSY